MARGRLLVDLGPLRQSQAFRRLWGGYLVTTLGSQLTVVAIPYQVFKLTHSSLDVGPRGPGADRARARRLAVRRLDRRCGRPAAPASRHAALARGLQRRARAELAWWARGALAAVRAERARVRDCQRRQPDAVRGVRQPRGPSDVRERRTPFGSCSSRWVRWPDPPSRACFSGRSASPRSTGSTPPPSPSRCWRSRAFPRCGPPGAAPASGCARSPRACGT